MGCFIFAAVVGGASLLAGWVLFPEPQFVRAFWASRGWTDKD